ncbi:hypothetical protein [Arthrobacter sp. R4-81]
MIPTLRASNESGETWDDPSEDLLFMLLEDIENGDETFAIVERLVDVTEQTYIQSSRNADGTYLVEYRDGTPDQHFSTGAPDMRAAHAVMTSWAFEEPRWRDSYIWTQLRF